MMGHISAAYAARVSRDLSMCSRFDFNVYSYDSEWTMGAEWWMRRAASTHEDELDPSLTLPEKPSVPDPHLESHAPLDIHGVVKAKISTNNVSYTALAYIEVTHSSLRMSH
jgi:distribution and morphology protein 10